MTAPFHSLSRGAAFAAPRGSLGHWTVQRLPMPALPRRGAPRAPFTGGATAAAAAAAVAAAVAAPPPPPPFHPSPRALRARSTLTLACCAPGAAQRPPAAQTRPPPPHLLLQVAPTPSPPAPSPPMAPLQRPSCSASCSALLLGLPRLLLPPLLHSGARGCVGRTPCWACWGLRRPFGMRCTRGGCRMWG